MPKLILIKHASPLVTPGVSSEKWSLSEKGRGQCPALADAIRAYQPARIISSTEPKAVETAELAAKELALPFESAEGLHEHDRSNVPHLQSREFISLVELFFRRPRELVLGKETADEALSRIERAVKRAMDRYPAESIAVVSHGTVIALLLAEYGGGNSFELWRKMGLPSFAVLDGGTMKVEKVVERV